jgi:hypothetical protein
MSRSQIGGVGVLLAILMTAVCSACRGASDEREKSSAIKPDSRDLEVLEVALVDYLDPANPARARPEKGEKPRTKAILDRKMVIIHADFAKDTIRKIEKDKVIDRSTSREILNQLAQQRPQDAYRLDEFRSRNANVVVIDVDKEFADVKPKSGGLPFKFADEFRRRYPDAGEYLVPSRPAFSSDGKTAAVMFYAGPAGHTMVWSFILRRESSSWRVIWRRFEVYL